MKRVFYYALGGGLGHLTRSLAVVHTLRLEGSVKMVVSTLPAEIPGFELPQQIELVGPPQGLDASSRPAVAAWIVAEAAQFEADQWFVDCFPAGVLGELASGSADVARTLVTRRVEWQAYRRRTPAIENWPSYSRVYVTESLDRGQAQDLNAIGPAPIDLELRDGCAPVTRRRLDHLLDSLDLGPLGETWLVVHSGPAGEVEQLLERAWADGGRDRKLLLVTPEDARPGRLPANVIHREIYPVWPLFDQVDRVYTAAGANSMRQLAPLHERHVAVPLRRRLDDQARRKALSRSSHPATLKK